MTNTVSRSVSDETLNAIIQIESNGNPRAKAPTSSALGLFQFLNATWLGVVKKHRPDLLEVPHDKLLFMRTDPVLCIELGARFTEDNLEAMGGNAKGGDLYLAHFLGTGDARKVMLAPPQQQVSELVREEVVEANRSIMQGKSCAQVRAWAAKRMYSCSGHDWIGRYWPAQEPEEHAPVQAEPDAEEIPDTQQAPPVPLPKPDPRPVPAPEPSPVAPKDSESFPSWLKRKGKTIASWAGAGTFGTVGLGSVTDWRIVAVIVGGLVISGALIGLFFIASQRKSS